MRILVCSDIHGSAYYAEKLIELDREQSFDWILLLGDVLYHGPRNPLPEGHDPMKVVELFNSVKEKMIAVRGNCDAEIDRALLDFSSGDDYTELQVGRHIVFATHGHVYGDQLHPELKENTVVMYGHFHIPRAEKENNIFYCNPGSASLPKGGYPQSYGILDEEGFTVYDFNQEIIKQIVF